MHPMCCYYCSLFVTIHAHVHSLLQQINLFITHTALRTAGTITAHLRKHAHRSHFVMLCCGLVLPNFIHILQIYFTGTGTLYECKQFCFVIHIKICAEYQDMLPRPRLVGKESGLRPISRSPGVPDKSSRGLGSMSRYSAQILICFIFIAYIFLFYSSVVLVGNFAGLPSHTVPSATVHCNQNQAGHQTIKAPSMPCWGAAGPCKHSLAFMPQDWWIWQIKWMKSVSMGSYHYKNQVYGEFFLIPVSNFTVFQPRI